MNQSRYTVEDLQLDMEMDTTPGEPPIGLPLVRFNYSFALNEIPQAVAIIAPGRDTRARKASPIHTEYLDLLRQKTKVRVYAKIRTMTRQNAPLLENWPKERFLIFEGTTTGPAWQISIQGRPTFTIGIEHWLADLSKSSAISPLFHPTNPSMFTFQAVLQPGGGGKIAGQGRSTAGSIAYEFIEDDVVQEDLWAGNPKATEPEEGKGIRGFFRRLASDDIASSSAALRYVPGLKTRGANTKALEALNRFEPRDGVYSYGVPLAMNLTGAAVGLRELSQTIAANMALDDTLSMANHTLWDKLLEYAQTYQFSIVPLVDRALIVPFVPCLKRVWRTIRADEYEMAGWSQSPTHEIGGIGLYGGKGYQAGADVGEKTGRFTRNGIGGYYLDPQRPDGMFQIMACPAWMSDIPYYNYTDFTTGYGGTRPVVSAIFPLVGSAIQLLKNVLTPAKVLESRTSFMNQFAQAIYAAEVVKGRAIDIMGRLRYDIAPGSSVGIESFSEAFIADDKLGEEFFGTVRRVSYVYDVDGPSVSTSFHLADLRTKAENADGSALSLDRHPMWSNVWTGSPLT